MRISARQYNERVIKVLCAKAKAGKEIIIEQEEYAGSSNEFCEMLKEAGFKVLKNGYSIFCKKL